MNKKANRGYRFTIGVFIVFFIVLFGSFIWLVIGMVFGDECKEISFSKLMAVDGRIDKNTGLFAGGSVGEKTLAFENGLIISYTGDEALWIGRYYNIIKCTNEYTSTRYKIE